MIVNDRQNVRELDGATIAGPHSSSARRRRPRRCHRPGDGVWRALLVGPVPDVAFDERRIAFVFLGGQVTELVETST
jgi:hypothetical protein